MEIFIELTLVLLLAVGLSFLMRVLRQPLIVGYILTGIIAGPGVLNLIHSHETIELFSKLGITILLFIVGLHMSPKVVKEIGSVSLITGVGQVVFTSAIGFAIALYLGIDRLAALYVAIALTFSSTIIILKLLSDKGSVQTLYGKISIGFLLVQDVIATLILIVISSLNTSSGLPLHLALGFTLGKGVLLLISLFAVTQWVLPKLTQYASKNTELLFLFSVTWGFAIAVLFSVAGLSIEIGALVAGVCLSASSYADEMSSRLRPLRDFFIILFFIFLGANMLLDSVAQIIGPALILSVFVLIGNPIIVIVLMNLLGYHRKTGFMAGLTVAQISEFSLILATLGLQSGHLSQEILTLVTLVGLLTIAGSTYLILYSDQLYSLLERWLKFLELRKSNKGANTKQQHYDVFLFGFHRVGKEFLELFKNMEYRMAVVDFDPSTAQRLPKRGVKHFYGDAGNVEFLQELPLQKARLAISSIPDLQSNSTLIRFLKSQNDSLVILSFAQNKQDALDLYAAGANYVVIPHHLAAKHVAQFVSRVGFELASFSRKQSLHVQELLQRVA